MCVPSAWLRVLSCLSRPAWTNAGRTFPEGFVQGVTMPANGSTHNASWQYEYLSSDLVACYLAPWLRLVPCGLPSIHLTMHLMVFSFGVAVSACSSRLICANRSRHAAHVFSSRPDTNRAGLFAHSLGRGGGLSVRNASPNHSIVVSDCSANLGSAVFSMPSGVNPMVFYGGLMIVGNDVGGVLLCFAQCLVYLGLLLYPPIIGGC